MNRSIFIFLFSCLFVSAACSQDSLIYDPNRLYSVPELQEDFMLMLQALDEGHAGLHHYNNKDKLDQHFQNAFALLNKPMTVHDFYKVWAPAISQIKCGHTAAYLPKEFYKTEAFLPLDIQVIDNQLFVRKDYQEENLLPIGTEIKAINGNEVKDFLPKLIECIPSDGDNETAKHRNLELGFFKFYAEFIQSTDTFNLTLIPPLEDSIYTQTVIGEVDSLQKKRSDAFLTKPLLSLQLEKDVALLNVRSFSPSSFKEQGINYRKGLKKAFKKIKKEEIEHLIIDLRWNGGGDPSYAANLYSYIAEEDFFFISELLINKNEPFHFLEYTNIKEIKAINPKRLYPDIHSDKYHWVQAEYTNPFKAHSKPYKGRVYILINGMSFSATTLVAAIAHSNKRATFFGEESGGNYHQMNVEFIPTFTMPNTRCRVRIPLLEGHLATKDYPHRNRGVIPHYPVKETYTDLLKKEDSTLKFVIQFIANKRYNK